MELVESLSFPRTRKKFSLQLALTAINGTVAGTPSLTRYTTIISVFDCAQ